MKGICPWCGKEVNTIAKHVLFCKFIPKELTKEEIRLKTFEFNLGKEIFQNICNDYKNLYSLTDLRTKYNLDFKSLIFILKQFNIKLRTLSESQHLITNDKSKKTCLEKYGVENPSQNDDIKKKKEQTFIKHYGVNNIWKTKEYAEFTSNRWASYSPEKKSELIHKWTKTYGSISKLENNIINILNKLNFPIETQFKFPKYFHKYDIHIKNTNIIIEINGDFWHANPNIYKKNDILNFPDKKRIAKDIWENDLKHKYYAESKNYKVIYIWENDINKNINNLDIFLLDILNTYLF